MNDLKKYIDPVFGEMEYKHGWFKNSVINLFGKNWNIKLTAQAYSEKNINNIQRENYSWFKQNFTNLQDKIFNLTKNYINNYLDKELEIQSNIKQVNTMNDLLKFVALKTILIDIEGSIILLLDFNMDEQGIGIKLYPRMDIGPQDIFL